MKQLRGFTLIEIIIVITISGIIAGIIGTLLRAGVDNYTTSSQLHELTLDANIALERLNKELVRAIEFKQVSSQRVSFVNYDGDTMTFSLNKKTLQMQKNNGRKAQLSTNVKAFNLSYADSSLATTTNKSQINLITLELTLTNATQDYSLISNVHPRGMA